MGWWHTRSAMSRTSAECSVAEKSSTCARRRAQARPGGSRPLQNKLGGQSQRVCARRARAQARPRSAGAPRDLRTGSRQAARRGRPRRARRQGRAGARACRRATPAPALGNLPNSSRMSSRWPVSSRRSACARAALLRLRRRRRPAAPAAARTSVAAAAPRVLLEQGWTHAGALGRHCRLAARARGRRARTSSSTKWRTPCSASLPVRTSSATRPAAQPARGVCARPARTVLLGPAVRRGAPTTRTQRAEQGAGCMCQGYG